MDPGFPSTASQLSHKVLMGRWPEATSVKSPFFSDPRDSQMSASAQVSVFISACPSNVLTLPQPQPTPFTFPTAPSVVFTPTSPGILSSTVPPQFLLPLYKANVSCQDRPGFLVGTITVSITILIWPQSHNSGPVVLQAQYAEPQFLSYSLVGTRYVNTAAQRGTLEAS